MKCGVIPFSMISKPPPFQKKGGVPKTHTSWAPEDWLGNDQAVRDAEARVARAERALVNAQTHLTETKEQHAAALAQAESLGYIIIDSK